MKFFKLAPLALLLLPLNVAAQWYDGQDNWGRYEGEIEHGQLHEVARALSNNANVLLNMVRNRRELRGPQRIDLYESVRNFAESARYYRANPSDWRARELVGEAENIDRIVNWTNLPFDFRDRWFAALDQVSILSQYYGVEFNWDRNMGRMDPYYYGNYDK